jgi:hypothetical protein
LDKWAVGWAVFLLLLAMLEGDCILLFGNLWINIVSYSWIHKDKKELSTWMYVGGVMEIDYLTSNQALKNFAKPKFKHPLLLTCGNSKTAQPT